MSKKKIIGLTFVHTIKLEHPIEADFEYLENLDEDLESPNKELDDITRAIFVGVHNFVDEFGQDYDHGVGRYIYEGEEL